jgi:hypothetical protein
MVTYQQYVRSRGVTAMLEIPPPITTYRGTFDEIASHKDELPPGAILELRIFTPQLDVSVMDFPPTGRAAAYLQRRLDTEATDDPEINRKADEGFEELKRNLNEERLRAGAEAIF